MSASLRYPARHGCFTEKRTLAELPKNVRKILAVRFGRLGDVILLLPSLHELKSCFPGASLTFVTDHRHASLGELCPFIDRVIPLNRLAMRDGQKAAALMAMWRLLCSLRDLHCDLAVDFHGFGESNLLTWLSRATHRVGLKKSNQTYYQFCFNTPPVIEDKNLHVADMFRRVVHAIPGVTPRGSQLAKVLIVQDSVKERIRSIAVNSPLMTLFVGARAADHLWPAARFARPSKRSPASGSSQACAWSIRSAGRPPEHACRVRSRFAGLNRVPVRLRGAALQFVAQKIFSALLNSATASL